MKKIKKTRAAHSVLFSFCFLFLSFIATSSAALPVHAKSEPSAVSPALYVLAEQNSMAKAGLKGNPLTINAEDFARAMNLSSVSKVTITQTPPITDGELRVGNTVVNQGTTISGSNLSLLTYVASSAEIATSSFRFSVNDSPVDMKCDLYVLDRINQCPTLSTVPESSLNVSTHRNITLYGTLPCYDPDGDPTQIEIVSYPKTGILILTDRTTGSYTYTPNANASGKDSFTYVARDKYGNYSAAATVSLSVVKPTTSVTYADLNDSPLYNAALDVTEAGIMSGSQLGNQTYFYPSQSVSRGEFVVMAMHALDMTELQSVSHTVFSDDDAIPESMKPYVQTAYRLGFIQGEVQEDGTLTFSPNREITRAEASVILGKMLNAPVPTVTPTFSDSKDIPTWAAPSMYSLNALGILASTDGAIAPMESLTRGDVAVMLSTVMALEN